MLLHLMLFIIKVQQVHSFLIQESYNIHISDSGHYKIDESINEDEYEMIDERQLAQFKIDDKENKLFELNKLASKEYEKSLTTKRSFRQWFRGSEPSIAVVTDEDLQYVTEFIPALTAHALGRRDVQNYSDEYLYDYNYLVKEYYAEAVEEASSNKSYHASKAEPDETDVKHSIKKIIVFDTKTRNCTNSEVKQIGFKALYCIYKDYRMHRESPRVLSQRLWRIVKIWFCAYLAVATPLWCTRGWCCCCLFCKFFKPHETIDEAKRYLVSNPPGMLSKPKGGHTEYEPTEYEKETYEQFEHLVRTI